MRALSLGLGLVFGLGWLGTLGATAALPLLLDGMPGLTGLAGIAGPAANTLLDWAATQTLMATALAAVAWLCAVAGARGWSVVALIAILPLLALAVVQFDPRIVSTLQDALGPAFDAFRARQAPLRLGLFTGLALIGAAHLLAGGNRLWPLAVSLAVLVSLALLLGGAPQGVALLGLPALVLLGQAGLRLGERGHPAEPYILTGVACVLIGSGLMLATDSPRQDLRAGFVLLPLFAALASRWQPRLPAVALWLHAGLIGAGLAYLAPGLGQFGDVPAATSFAEITATLRRAEALRNGAGGLLGLLAVLGLLAFRRRRHRPAPAS